MNFPWSRCVLFRMRRYLLLALLTTSLSLSQGGGSASIDINETRGRLVVQGPRPLAGVALALAAKFGMAISVEDPSYEFEGDLVDVTALSKPGKLVRPVFVPRGGRLEIPFEATADGRPANRIKLVDDVIEAANAELPFAYRLDVSALPFAIVPTKTRNARGEIVEFTPLLDRVVSIPRGRRRVHESAGLLAQALSDQTGVTVSCCQGAVVGYPWGMQETEFAASEEPARDVLRRLSKLTPGRYIWLMNCDPSPGNFCLINLHRVNTTP